MSATEISSENRSTLSVASVKRGASNPAPLSDGADAVSVMAVRLETDDGAAP